MLDMVWESWFSKLDPDAPEYDRYLRYWGPHYVSPSRSVAGTRAWLTRFWRDREAIQHLPALAGRACAYVRIQGYFDHAYAFLRDKPTWLNGWSAIKALNAAFAGGNENVHFFTIDSWTDSTIAPDRMVADFDEADPHLGWPEWYEDPDQYSLEIRMAILIHGVRWAMRQAFPWEP